MVQTRTKELIELALHDRLTSLPNRTLLLDRLTQAIQRRQRDPAYHFALLFLDFDSGDTLQLTGTTEILWDEQAVRDFSGAQRLIRFRIERVIATSNLIPFTWKVIEYSPFNPQQK